MTTLDRTLVKTFRWARWQESAGVPVCASCFDGNDLAEPTDDPLTPGLSRYRCTVCHTEFSDATGTAFESRKPVSLMLWAYLVLLGDPGRLAGLTERELRRCWELTAKIKTARLTGAWREQLDAAGITAEHLRKILSRTARRAA